MSARRAGLALIAWLACALPAGAAEPGPEAVLAPANTRNGQEIYRQFREGLADPACKADASARWQAHFAHAPTRLVSRDEDVLPLFGYVVDAVRAAGLPTEFALIPFVESGYRPAARSAQGPTGLWQMIAITARNHKVPMRAGYDGRLSPIDSTTAAVRYLKTLYGMFAGDWRLAVMAYNAGEYRVLGALRRAGQTARAARPEALPGLSPITHAYVRKLHALSCLLERADDREEWLRALDRPVPLLAAVAIPQDITDLATWARRNGQDPARVQRLNPVFVHGRISRANGKPARLLAALPAPPSPAAGALDDGVVASVATLETPAPATGSAPDSPPAPEMPVAIAEGRRHTVVRGDNPTKIAARYGVRVRDLLERNGLRADSVLRPGKVLLIDAVAAPGEVPAAAAATP
ncbi:transglycosylase SLT domain-containing protein [Lysobacter yangpyeongensis]|uniref:Transglycosylase SLT domain-containing protein n=1 Tax=Lysobacter yangpyeongensis TaxID=346182 RepID=A0ABW0SKS4_9GAMM